MHNIWCNTLSQSHHFIGYFRASRAQVLYGLLFPVVRFRTRVPFFFYFLHRVANGKQVKNHLGLISCIRRGWLSRYLAANISHSLCSMGEDMVWCPWTSTFPFIQENSIRQAKTRMSNVVYFCTLKVHSIDRTPGKTIIRSQCKPVSRSWSTYPSLGQQSKAKHILQC